MVFIGRFNTTAGNTASIAGGGLVWTTDADSGSGTRRVYIFSAPCPAGLAAGTVLTVTHAGSVPANTDALIAALSLLNVDTSTPVVSAGSNTGSLAAWSSGTVSGAQNGNAIVGGAFIDGLVGTSNPDAPGVEWADFNSAGQTETATGVYKLIVAGPDSVSGTWSGAAAWAGAAVAYKAAGAAPVVAPFQPVAILGLGRGWGG